MALKAKEQAVVDLVINGEQAKSSLREITGALNAVRSARAQMNKEEDPERYDQLIAQERALAAAQKARREEVIQGAEAQKGFFADFKKGFSEITEMAGEFTAGTLIYKGISSVIEGVKSIWNGGEEAYKEAQRAQTQLQAVLKSTGGVAGESSEKLLKYQESLMNLTGVDDDVIAKGEEMLLTFSNIRGKIYEQALPAIVDMTSAMNNGTVSMEGIQKTALQVGKALQDPIAGATALKKVGVTLDDQQKQQIKTMVSQNDVMGAQAVIIKELNKEFGGTAKALADTDVGKIQAYETALGNLQEVIGKWIIAGKGLIADYLGPIVKLLSDGRNEAQRLTEDYYNQANAVDQLQKNTVPLINRYDELKGKSSLNKDEQVELNKIMNTLATTIPGAVTEWDKYGNAIGINTDKAREFIKMQKAMLSIQNKDAIDKTESMIKDLEGRQQRILDALKDGTKVVINSAGGGMRDDIKQAVRKMTDAEILELRGQLPDIQKQIEEAKLGVAGLKGENLTIPTPETVTKPQGGPSAADIAAAEAAKKKLAEFILQSKELTEKYKEFNAAQLADDLAKNDKEVADAAAKYNKMIADEQSFLEKAKLNKYANADQIRIHESEITRLQQASVEDANRIRARQEQELTTKLQNFRDQLNNRVATEQEKELDQLNKFYDEQAAAAGSNEKLQAQIAEDREQAIADLKLRTEKKLQDDIAKIKSEAAVSDADKDALKVAQINKQYDDEITALKAKYTKELQATQSFQDAMALIEKNRKAELNANTRNLDEEKSKNLKQFAIQEAQELSNSLFTISNRNRQAEADAQIKALETQKDKELSNKNLTETQKQAINDKYAKQEAELKLQAWKADKAAAEEQAVINGALAVVKALAQVGPLGAFVIPGIIASTAAQVAIIASQKPPQFADGGLIPAGPSHADGGINLVNNKTGKPIAQMEGGEPIMILSRETQKNNGALINQLLFNSMYRNGATVDVASVSGGIAMARYGGVFNKPANNNMTGSDQVSGNTTGSPVELSTERLDRIEAAIENLHGIVSKEAVKPVVLSRRVMDQEDAKQTVLTRSVNA